MNVTPGTTTTHAADSGLRHPHFPGDGCLHDAFAQESSDLRNLRVVELCHAMIGADVEVPPFRWPKSAAAEGVLDVVALSADVEVLDIDAGRVVAVMQDTQSFGDGAVREYPRLAVRPHLDAVEAGAAVTALSPSEVNAIVHKPQPYYCIVSG